MRDWREHSNRFYEALVKERGEGFRAFWGSKESQTVRFDVFLRHLPLHGASVLDVGCGFGDFLDHARSAGTTFSRYLGVDLDPIILDGARRRQPDAEFQVLDLLAEDLPANFGAPDFIVASGIACVPFDGYEDYVQRLLRRFYTLCRRGFALNFLSTRGANPDGRSRYADPAWVLSLFQRTCDWRCLLVHDYRPNDFTLVHRKG